VKEAETRELEPGRMSRRGRRGRRGAGTSTGAAALERFVKENASGLTFLGVTLSVFVSRKFLILPVAIGLMLAQEKLAAAGLDRARRALRR